MDLIQQILTKLLEYAFVGGTIYGTYYLATNGNLLAAGLLCLVVLLLCLVIFIANYIPPLRF